MEFTKFCADRVAPWIGTAYCPDQGKNHVRFAFCSPQELEKKMNQQLKKTLIEYEKSHKYLIITR